MGRSRDGNLIIIVAHGIGPMRDRERMVQAYRPQFRNKKDRDIRGGLISQEDFLRLESGFYGDVEVVDLAAYLQRYEYPFISDLDNDQARTDPLVRARLGAQWSDYIWVQTAIRDRWYAANQEEERGRLRQWGVSRPRPPKIISLRDNSNFNYTSMARYPDYLNQVTDDGKFAVAHLLSVGGVSVVRYCASDADFTGVVTDIGLHAWYDGTRFVGVRAGSDLSDIHPGPTNLRPAIRKHWKDLGVPAGPKDTLPRARAFYRLDDGHQFTVRQDDDRKVMQSSDPEFWVCSATMVGHVESFVTEIEGYHGFFRYCPKDVRRIAPPEANAFNFVSDGKIIYDDAGNPTHHQIDVAFYRADVDTSLRLPTEDEVRENFDLTMKLTLDEF